jgi:hypothetical protein
MLVNNEPTCLYDHLRGCEECQFPVKVLDEINRQIRKMELAKWSWRDQSHPRTIEEELNEFLNLFEPVPPPASD